MAAPDRETSALTLRPATRSTALAVLFAVLAPGCGQAVLEDRVAARDLHVAETVTVSPSPTATPVSELPGLQATLDDVAAAFRAADPDSLRPHLDDPDSLFGRRWLDRARNLSDVPLSHYRLVIDDALPDLATDRVRGQHGEEARVVYVVEEHALEGFDPSGPAVEDLFLTVVPGDDGRWRVVGDEDAEPLGLVSVDHLWDHGPVVATRAGPVLALHHPEADDIGVLLEEANAAIDDVRARWPLAWPERVPIIVPRDQAELAQLLHVTFDLTNFIAFATATPDGELSEYELTGSRILINPDRFLGRSTSTRRSILAHELLHVATRPSSGPMVPSWLEEGVAQALGERRSTTGTRLLDALVARGVEPDLPTDGEFTTGGRDRIFLSYQTAWSFAEHLRERYGDDRVAAFYAAVGRGAVGEPGTEAWHVDRGAREVFGASLDELVQEWRDSLP